MADCECLGGCPFFNDQMKGLEAIKKMMKDKYCKGSSEACARYIVFKALGKPRVPGNLIPNQVERARQLIAQA
jgi:hypothetical protein